MPNLANYPHVKVVIVPADQPHVAIMSLLTEGISTNGELPFGAEWISEPTHWLRTPTPEVVEHQILKWRALDSPSPRPAPLRWFVAKPGDVPTDRTYRNAQVAHATEARVEHDMPIARELHRDILRTERVERLLQLDAQWFAATRDGDATAVAAIDAEKQVMLDSTDDPRIEAASTVDELKPLSLDLMLQEAQTRGEIAAPLSVKR